MEMRIKQAYIFFLPALICAVMCGYTQKKELSFETAYVIDADLDPEMRRMTYTETAKIINTGYDSTECNTSTSMAINLRDCARWRMET